MKNKQFNNESDLKEEMSRFFRGKIKYFYKIYKIYKIGIYKLLNRWEKVIESLYFDE